MSGGAASLAMAPEPFAAPRPAMSLPFALRLWCRREQPDEERSLLLFGVGLVTLGRIARHEVAPEPEVAERIWATVGTGCGYGHGPSAARGGAERVVTEPSPPDAGADEAGETPLLRGFFLVNQAGKGWAIGFWWRDKPVRISLEDARHVLADLGPLVAQHDARFPK